MNPPKVKNPSKQIPVRQLTYEQAFSELEQIVANLESGDSSLENSLALFERGQELSRYCANLLEKAELKVKQLSAEGIIPFTSLE